MSSKRCVVPQMPVLPLLLLWLAFSLWSCEEEFTPEPGEPVDELVVEGYLEAGDQPVPAFVLLTRSFPFFSQLSAQQLANAFVKGAEVSVSDGSRTITLTEVCLSELPPVLRAQVAEFLGLDPNTIGFDVCAYADVLNEMPAEEGKTYTLRIEAEGKVLTAQTTIPALSRVDSVFFVPPPGEPNDTLAQCRVILDDPAGIPNFYRYFTASEGRPLEAPFGSVTDDRLFDGQRFEFPLPKAEPRNAEFNLETFGLYLRGDTVTIKLANIDQAHFNFWNTLEFNAANQGPFSSYTRVDHNINGGLGIWGGLHARYFNLVVPPQ